MCTILSELVEPVLLLFTLSMLPIDLFAPDRLLTLSESIKDSSKESRYFCVKRRFSSKVLRWLLF